VQQATASLTAGLLSRAAPGYRSIRPRVDPPYVRPKRGRSTSTSGTIRPKFWVVPPQHP